MFRNKALPVIIVLAGCCSKYGSKAPASAQREKAFRVFSGKIADTRQEDCSLPGLLKHEKSRVVYHFFASWCQSCREELSALGKKETSIPGHSRIVHISLDANATEAERTLKNAGLKNYSLVHDPSGKLLAALGADSLPLTVVFNSGGRLITYSEGPSLVTTALSEESLLHTGFSPTGTRPGNSRQKTAAPLPDGD